MRSDLLRTSLCYSTWENTLLEIEKEGKLIQKFAEGVNANIVEPVKDHIKNASFVTKLVHSALT